MAEGKKGHQYLDAMRPATRISMPLEKETERENGKLLPKRKEVIVRRGKNKGLRSFLTFSVQYGQYQNSKY